jgi:hypothetical protein
MPLGDVKELVAVEALVKPGSSGAPVVNEEFEVLGFIVAGAMDRLPSYMFPAYFWAGALDTRPRRSRGSERAKSTRGTTKRRGTNGKKRG